MQSIVKERELYRQYLEEDYSVIIRVLRLHMVCTQLNGEEQNRNRSACTKITHRLL